MIRRRLESTQLKYLLCIALLQGLTLIAFVSTRAYCCDAIYYRFAGEGLLAHGFHYVDDYMGYRSYLPALVVGIFAAVGRVLGISGDGGYGVIAATVFIGASSIALRHAFLNAKSRLVIPSAFATVANPFVLALVPFSLQEGLVVIMFAPIALIVLCDGFKTPEWRLSVLVVVTTVTALLKPSLIWICIPFGAYCLRKTDISDLVTSTRLRMVLGTSIAAASLMLLVQSYWMRVHRGVFMPYDSASRLSDQFSWGEAAVRYFTFHDGNGWLGVWTVFPSLGCSGAQEAIAGRGEMGYVWIALAHAFFGFIFDSPFAYVTAFDLAFMPIVVFLCGVVVSAALVVILQANGALLKVPSERFALLLVVTSLIYVIPLAVESRFGILGFVGACAILAQAVGRGAVTFFDWRFSLAALVGGAICVGIYASLADSNCVQDGGIFKPILL